MRPNNFNRLSFLAATALVVASVITWLVPAASAQSGAARETDADQSETPAVEQVAAPPTPIPASQISARAQETTLTLRALGEKPDPDPDVSGIKAQLPEVLARYQTLLDQTESALATSVSVRELDDMERRWRREQDRVRGWNDTVQRRARALDRDLETLHDQRNTWEATRGAAGEAQYPEALIEVINSTLASVRSVAGGYGEERADLLNVEQQIARATGIIRDGLGQLAAARAEAPSRLLALDAPPLWKLLANPPPRTRHAAVVREVLRTGRQDLRDYFRNREETFLAYGLLFVAIILMLVGLRRRIDVMGEDHPRRETARRILSRPVSSSILLTVALFLTLNPEAPRILDDIILVILFVPLLRIIPGSMMSGMRGMLVALVSLSTLVRLVGMLVYLSLLQRIGLLLCASLSVVALLRLIHGRMGIDVNAHRTVRISARIGLVLLIVAIVLNIVGEMSTSLVATGAVITAGYLGLILYITYRIIESMLWIALGTGTLRRLRMVERHAPVIRHRILRVVRGLGIIYYVAASLSFLQFRDPVWNTIVAVFTAEANFGDVHLSLATIMAFAVTVWAAFKLSQFIRFVLEEDVYWRMDLPRGIPQAISIGINYTVLLVGFFLAVAAMGLDLNKFTLLAGAFGVGLGFGLQNVVNNFVSGLILVVERPVMPGDTVQIGTTMGEVKRIGLRSSTIRSWEGAEVIVPNGNLISQDVINWTLSDRQRRLDIDVGVAYGTDTAKVIELLLEVGKNHPDAMERPEPTALFIGFGDSSLNFQLRVWTERSERFMAIKSEVTLAVERAIKEAGITIPFPQRDLHFRTPLTTAPPDDAP